MAPRDILSMIKEAFRDWNEDNAPRLGAALSYYTIFSIAPLLLISIAAAGLVFGQEAAQGRIVAQIQGLIGREAAEAVQGMIENARKPGEGVMATIFGTAMLLFGAGGAFNELRATLDVIWEIPPRRGGGIKALLRERLLSFAMVLVVGFLLLVSLVLSAAISLLEIKGEFRGSGVVLQVVNNLVSLAVITVLFALIFKYLPDAHPPVAWKGHLGGRVHHRLPVHARQVRRRPVSRAQQRGLRLRGGRLPGPAAHLGLLLGADPVLRGRADAGERTTAWLSAGFGFARGRGRGRGIGVGGGRCGAVAEGRGAGRAGGRTPGGVPRVQGRSRRHAAPRRHGPRRRLLSNPRCCGRQRARSGAASPSAWPCCCWGSSTREKGGRGSRLDRPVPWPTSVARGYRLLVPGRVTSRRLSYAGRVVGAEDQLGLVGVVGPAAERDVLHRGFTTQSIGPDWRGGIRESCAPCSGAHSSR